MCAKKQTSKLLNSAKSIKLFKSLILLKCCQVLFPDEWFLKTTYHLVLRNQTASFGKLAARKKLTDFIPSTTPESSLRQGDRFLTPAYFSTGEVPPAALFHLRLLFGL